MSGVDVREMPVRYLLSSARYLFVACGKRWLVPGGVAELWDRVVASDPGLGRLRMAGSGALSMASALGVEYLFAVLVQAGSMGTLISMLLGAIVAMMGSMALTGHGVWPKVRNAVFFPVAIGAGMVAGIAVAGSTDLMLAVFVAVMFAAVFVRRFGIPFFFYGFMGWMGYFFASFLHASWAMVPSMLVAIVIGTVWVLLLSTTVLRVNPTRTLRRTVRACDASARAVARAGAEVLARAGDQQALRRARSTLRRRQARLSEVALMVEAWSGEPGAMPQGRSAPALRRRLIDAQQALDTIAGEADALATADPTMADLAFPVLDRLARRNDVGAEQAARTLDTTLDGPRDGPCDGSRDCLGSGQQAGAAAARHLAAAVLEFVALARAARVPPKGTDVHEDAEEDGEEFEPAVMLAMGNLPGSPAVARDVPAHQADWNPLARLDMTSRQAIQVALAGALAIVAGRMLDPTRYYWAVIAAFIMFTGTATRSETFLKGVNRVLGTLVGLVAAIWLAQLTAGNTALVLVVIVASMFLGFYLIRLSYAFMIFFITIMIGQLYTVLNMFSDALLVLRLEETAIGAAAGFLVALVVTPLGTRQTVRAARNALLDALAELLDEVGTRLAGDRPEPAATGSGEGGGQGDQGEGDEDTQESPAAPRDVDALARGLDDRARQLALVAKPLTRPLVWGNSPPRTRHRLALYGAAVRHARALAVALRQHPQPRPGLAVACRALAAAAREMTEIAPGQQQPLAAAPLTEADTALFGDEGGPSAQRATNPITRPLIHLHQLLRELALPGHPHPGAASPEPAPQGSGDPADRPVAVAIPQAREPISVASADTGPDTNQRPNPASTARALRRALDTQLRELARSGAPTATGWWFTPTDLNSDTWAGGRTPAHGNANGTADAARAAPTPSLGRLAPHRHRHGYDSPHTR